MPTFASPMPKGKTSPAGFLRILGKIFTGSGVVEADALKVTAQGTPDMSVVVSGSALDDNAILIHTDGTFIHAWNDQDETVAIPANATGVTKTDAVVAYLDLSMNDGVPLEDLTPNNQDALKFKVIRRSGNLTGNPLTSEINADADVGSNPYLVLAYVTVGAGVGSSPGDAINSGNITDARTRAQVEADRLGPIGPNQITDAAVTTAKLNDASVTAAKLGSLTSSGFDVNLVNGAISGLTHSIMVGTTGAGVAQFKATLNISSASIPVTAKVIRFDFWVMAAGNNSQVVRCPVIAYSTTNNGSILTSVSFQGLTAANDTGFPNNTNSRLQGSITYID